MDDHSDYPQRMPSVMGHRENVAASHAFSTYSSASGAVMPIHCHSLGLSQVPAGLWECFFPWCAVVVCAVRNR